jgi:hypothetical protein
MVANPFFRTYVAAHNDIFAEGAGDAIPLPYRGAVLFHCGVR